MAALVPSELPIASAISDNDFLIGNDGDASAGSKTRRFPKSVLTSFVQEVAAPSLALKADAATMTAALALKTNATTTTALSTRVTTAETDIDAIQAGAVTVIANGIYANNAEALAAGLTPGMLYMTSTGEVRGVLPQGGGGGVIVAPPPTGSELISTATVTDPHYDGSSSDYYWVWGKPWAHDSAYKSWSIFSADDNVVRFEVRPGDRFTKPSFTDSTGIERNRLVEADADWHAKTEDILGVGYVMIEGPIITSNYFQVIEIHTFGGTLSQTAKKFELVISNEHWQVTANANGAYDTPYTGTAPIVRGKWYKVLVYVKSATSGGRVICEIDDTRVVNKTGYVGHPTETEAAVELGIYRGTSTPETVQVSHRDWVWTFGAHGTITEPGTPEAPGTGTTYGPNLVTNGTFTTTDNWTATGATLSVASNELTITESTSGSGTHSASQPIAVENGATYRIQAEAYMNANAISVYAVAFQGSALTATGTDETTSTTLDVLDFTVVSAGTSFTLHLHVDGGDIGDIGKFRNVTVRKVL